MRISRYEFNSLHDFRPRVETFALDEVIEDMQKETVVEPVKPTFTEDQLAAAREEGRKAGYAEGFEAATTEANTITAQRDRDMQVVLEGIEQQLKAQQSHYDDLIANETRDLSQLIIAAARKIAGDALTQKPEVTVQELLSQCLPIILTKPRVIIDIHPSIIEATTQRITPFLTSAGFEGDVQFRGNDALSTHDAIVEWTGGRAVRNHESMWQEIERMVNQLSFAPTPPSRQTPREPQE